MGEGNNPPDLKASIHELNNNLQGIIGNATLLLQDKKKLSLSDKTKARNILKCAERASKATEGLLNQAQEAEEISINSDSLSAMVLERSTVLVIDDEEVVRSFIKNTLKEAGYSTLVAATGAEGVKLFEKNQNKIRCVILDLTMPYMCGSLVFAKLKAINPEIPVYLMSGYRDVQVKEQYREEGMAGFIKKPFKPDKLLKAVNFAQAFNKQAA